MLLMMESRFGAVEALASPAASPEEEARRAALLATVLGRTERELRDDARLTRVRADALVETARAAVLDLFPGSAATYQMLIAPRFARLLTERFGPAAPRASVLPFRRREAA